MKLLEKVINKAAHLLLHTESFKGYLEPLVQQFKPAWRAGFYRAKVIKIITLPANCISLELRPERSWPSHQAGQHVLLSCQFNGRLMTRTFSISSSQGQAERGNHIRLTIKTAKNGAFTSQLANELAVGDFVNLSEPMGEFLLPSCEPNSTDELFFIAAGSGITPFMAMLHTLAEREHIRTQNIYLCYFAKQGEHLFIDELTELKRFIPRLNVMFLVRKQGDSLASALKNVMPTSQVLICGPQQFKQDVDAVLNHFGHLSLNRQAEFFQTPLSNENNADIQQVTVLRHGQVTELLLTGNENLLNGLEQQGLSPNFGCRIGVCHQCQCIKKSGIVKNLRTGEQSDTGEQLIQLCISQAITPLELEL